MVSIVNFSSIFILCCIWPIGHQRSRKSHFPLTIECRAKKVINVCRCPIFRSKSSKEQKREKRSSTSANVPYSTEISKVYISVSARGPHKMISRTVVCPPLVYTSSSISLTTDVFCCWIEYRIIP